MRPSTRSVPMISTGDTRKCRWIRTGAPVGSRSANPRRISRLRSRVRFGLRAAHSALRWSRATSCGSTITSTPGSSPSSFSSLLVNAAWAGPRRPRTWISRMRLLGELLEGVLGDVGLGEDVLRAGEDPGEVHRHVPVAHHRRRLRLEVEAEVAEVGVGVVPADELGGGVAPRQVLAGDPHPPVGAGADRVDDRVVVRLQVGVGDVPAHLHVPVEAELGVGGDLVVHAGDRLDLLVVRRDAAAHQPERGGQAVVHVDLDLEVLLLLQVLGGVEAAGAGADHGHPQRVVRRAEGGRAGGDPIVLLRGASGVAAERPA